MTHTVGFGCSALISALGLVVRWFREFGSGVQALGLRALGLVWPTVSRLSGLGVHWLKC